MKERNESYLALDAFLDSELKTEYCIDYTIKSIDSCKHTFDVLINDKCFNDVEIKVVEVDSDDLAYSQFEIHIHEDYHEMFNLYSSSLCEFWKKVLWSQS